MGIADFFGYAGTIVGASLMFPQAWKMWRTKSVEDISAVMLALYFFNCLLWLIYAVLMSLFPLALTNAIGLVISIAQIAFKILYRDNR